MDTLVSDMPANGLVLALKHECDFTMGVAVAFESTHSPTLVMANLAVSVLSGRLALTHLCHHR